jgi:hypothetical protein
MMEEAKIADFSIGLGLTAVPFLFSAKKPNAIRNETKRKLQTDEKLQRSLRIIKNSLSTSSAINTARFAFQYNLQY